MVHFKSTFQSVSSMLMRNGGHIPLMTYHRLNLHFCSDVMGLEIQGRPYLMFSLRTRRQYTMFYSALCSLDFTSSLLYLFTRCVSRKAPYHCVSLGVQTLYIRFSSLSLSSRLYTNPVPNLLICAVEPLLRVSYRISPRSRYGQGSPAQGEISNRESRATQQTY
jgi:hypothetical protein